MKDKDKKTSLMVILSYLTIYIVWGSTYFFIKLSVKTLPPYYIIGIRFLFGGTLFLIISILTGKLNTLPTIKEIFGSIILGTLLLLAGNGLITVAEQKIQSYIAALLVASTPIFVAFFNRAVLRIKIGPIKLTGIIIGIAGVALLLYNGKSISTSISLHLILAVIGIACWGFATSIGHKFKTPEDSLVNTMIQMLFVGIISFIIMGFSKTSLFEALKNASILSLAGVGYLAVIGSIALSAYNFLIKNEPSIRIVSYALINPIIAVLVGLLVGKESIMPFFFFGLPMVIFGLFMMFYGDIIINRLKNKIR